MIELNDTQKSIIDTFQKVIQSSNIKYLANTLDLEIDKMGNAADNTLHILNEFKNILDFTINIKDIYKCEYCNYTTEELKHRSFILSSNIMSFPNILLIKIELHPAFKIEILNKYILSSLEFILRNDNINITELDKLD